MDRSNKPIIIIVFLLIIAGIALYLYSADKSVPNTDIDEVSTSTNTSAPAGWDTYSDEATGISFQYPKDLGLNYVHTVDWPPQVNLIEEAYSCTEAGEPTDRAGGTREVSINGKEYCMTEESEGAAGSVYSQYAYAFDEKGRTAILTFTIREVQCANYDADKAAECSLEQASFNPDTLALSIARTLRIEE